MTTTRRVYPQVHPLGGVEQTGQQVAYALRTYGTASAIRAVLEDVRTVRQKADEVEDNYRKRLNKAIFRCGIVQNEDEKITLYVDRLLNTIRMEVAPHCESDLRRDLPFESLCHFAKSEDEAYRASFQL